MTTHTTTGFSLLEILLVIAMFGIVAAFISPTVHASYITNNLRTTNSSVRNALWQARAFTLSQKNHTSWGVHITSSTITVFDGINFSSRTIAREEITNLPGGITNTGLTDIVFSGLYAKPLTTGTIQLATDSGQTISISINEEGAF